LLRKCSLHWSVEYCTHSHSNCFRSFAGFDSSYSYKGVEAGRIIKITMNLHSLQDMSTHIKNILGTFSIIFSSKYSRTSNQCIGSSLNHLPNKIILKIGSYNSNVSILLLCLVESILIQ